MMMQLFRLLRRWRPKLPQPSQNAQLLLNQLNGVSKWGTHPKMLTLSSLPSSCLFLFSLLWVACPHMVIPQQPLPLHLCQRWVLWPHLTQWECWCKPSGLFEQMWWEWSKHTVSRFCKRLIMSCLFTLMGIYYHSILLHYWYLYSPAHMVIIHMAFCVCFSKAHSCIHVWSHPEFVNGSSRIEKWAFFL